MKKLSRTTAVSMMALAGLGLSACHPPSQQPSDKKVPNASTFTGDVTPGDGADASAGSTEPTQQSGESTSPQGQTQFANCIAPPAVEPSTVSLDCISNQDQLVDIAWESWNKDSASGTATRLTGESRTEDVEVELRNPVQVDTGVVFTEIVVDGETIVQ